MLRIISGGEGRYLDLLTLLVTLRGAVNSCTRAVPVACAVQPAVLGK